MELFVVFGGAFCGVEWGFGIIVDFSLYHIFISDARRGNFVRRAGFYQFF